MNTRQNARAVLCSLPTHTWTNVQKRSSVKVKGVLIFVTVMLHLTPCFCCCMSTSQSVVHNFGLLHKVLYEVTSDRSWDTSRKEVGGVQLSLTKKLQQSWQCLHIWMWNHLILGNGTYYNVLVEISMSFPDKCCRGTKNGNKTGLLSAQFKHNPFKFTLMSASTSGFIPSDDLWK